MLRIVVIIIVIVIISVGVLALPVVFVFPFEGAVVDRIAEGRSGRCQFHPSLMGLKACLVDPDRSSARSESIGVGIPGRTEVQVETLGETKKD